jgi:hypothetical protein
MSGTKYRNFVFTYFTDNLEWRPRTTDVSYIIYQFEKCPETGRIHAQGYCELKNQKKLKNLKISIFGDDKAHIEKRNKSQESAINYCKKEDTRFAPGWEFGEPKKQGKRNDLTAYKDICKNLSVPVMDIIDEFPNEFIKYPKSLDRIRFERLKELSKCFRRVKGYILWGEPGTGKTRRVYEKYGYDAVYKVRYRNDGTIWWDGYYGQRVILFDDFYGQVLHSEMLKLLDGYPLDLEIKGGHTCAYWKRVFITTNRDPSDLYTKVWSNYPTEKSAFFRRIVKVVKYN